MNLTIHLILRSQTNLLSQTLESVLCLKPQILVADLGVNHATLEACKAYRVDVKKYSWHKNLSEVRNLMLKDSKTDWNMYLEPWEAVVAGHEHITELIAAKPAGYRMAVMTGESIRKETRLWHKKLACEFSNPVFETLNVSSPDHCQAVIWENKVDRPDLGELLTEWEKKMPFSQDMRYFKALRSLAGGHYQEFTKTAKQYLLQQKTQPIAISMIRYYLGLVECIVDSDLREATRNAVLCIAENPLMAEFWCLLGDIAFKAQDYGRAECYYQNAKVLGARRLAGDAWPMHVPKYDEYPTNMIAQCRHLKS